MRKKNHLSGGKDGWRSLLVAHLVSPADAEQDEALFLSLPAEKRDVVLQRLEVLDGYLSLPEPSVARADEAAARLGISRRTFYHLLGKLKAHGPVKGLALGFRLNRRPSVARDGLSGTAEEVLAEAFNKDPEVRAGVAYRTVVQACERAGATPPKETEVRFRLHELRRAQRSLVAKEARVGASLLVDQCYIDLVSTTHPRERRQVMVTLIVDRITKLILGYGVSLEEQDASPLESALHNAQQKRLPEFAEVGLDFAAAPTALEFIVPPGFEGLGSAWQDQVRARFPGIDLAVNDAGPLRHGFALVRLLGDRLGAYSFRTRARPAEANLESMIEHDPEVCHRVVGYCVDAWNRPIVAALSAGKVDHTRAAAEAARLAGSLNQLFDLFLDQVEKRFPNADLWRKARNAWMLDI